MKKFIAVITAITALSTAGTAWAAENVYTNGMIKKLDAKQNKITIKHEELKNLDMPGMTMVFAKGEKVDIAKLKEGQKIKFIADRVNGQLTVTEVK